MSVMLLPSSLTPRRNLLDDFDIGCIIVDVFITNAREGYNIPDILNLTSSAPFKVDVLPHIPLLIYFVRETTTKSLTKGCHMKVDKRSQS
jgi:hypothetical protein